MAANIDIISFDSMPVGSRFQPTEEECLTCYLKPRICGNQFDSRVIPELNVYDWDPEELPQKFRELSIIRSKDQEWWFICPLQFTTSSKTKIRRKTKSGFWKVTGNEKPVQSGSGEEIGVRRLLVFYHDCYPKPTDWKMHEYRLKDNGVSAIIRDQDELVLYHLKKTSNDVSSECRLLDSDDEEAEHRFPEETIQATMKSLSDLLPQPVTDHVLASQSHSYPKSYEFCLDEIMRDNLEDEHDPYPATPADDDDDLPESSMQIDLEGDSVLTEETLTEVYGQGSHQDFVESSQPLRSANINHFPLHHLQTESGADSEYELPEHQQRYFSPDEPPRNIFQLLGNGSCSVLFKGVSNSSHSYHCREEIHLQEHSKVTLQCLSI